MRFDIYGRFQVEVRRENGVWAVYRAELGKRTLLFDVVIPPELEDHEVATWLDDVFHEFARAGERVALLPDHTSHPGRQLVP